MNEHVEHVEHVDSPRTFIFIWAALLILALVTTGVSFIDLGPFNVIVALLIATTKAVLVVLFFMEVRYSSKITKVTIVSAFFFLILLLGLSLTDYISRGWPR